MITPIIVVSLKFVGPFTVVLLLFSGTTMSVLILIDQKMLTDTNYSTCCSTLFLVQEITIITVITLETFEKTRLGPQRDKKYCALSSLS